MKYLDYTIRVFIAVILLQTLWFKFRAAPESVAIFTALGVEPWGRIFAGGAELLASLMLLFPRTALYGALLSAAAMLGAMLAHIFVIGIVTGHDGGLLFILAAAVAAGSLFCIYRRRAEALSQVRALWR